jgi:hypothetical protein
LWIILVDLLELAKQRHQRDGHWPTQAELITWMHALGFLWCGENLFISDFDASESLFHDEILEAAKIA